MFSLGQDRYVGLQGLTEQVVEASYMLRHSFLVGQRFGKGGLHACDAGKVLGSAPQAPLLSAAFGEVLDSLGGVIEKAHALRAVEFVGAEGGAVNIPGGEVDREFSELLGRVGMEMNRSAGGLLIFTDDPGEGGDVLKRTHGIVQAHDRNEAGFGSQGFFKILRVDEPPGGSEHDDLPASLLKNSLLLDDRRVFDARDDHFPRTQAQEQGLKNDVVRFGGPAGEDDMVWPDIEHFSDRIPYRFQIGMGFPPFGIFGGRVRPVLESCASVAFKGFCAWKGGGSVIEIAGGFHSLHCAETMVNVQGKG